MNIGALTCVGNQFESNNVKRGAGYRAVRYACTHSGAVAARESATYSCFKDDSRLHKGRTGRTGSNMHNKR